MTWQTMMELSEGWDVYTPLGRGTVLVVGNTSYLTNSVMWVKIQETGELKHFDSNDIRFVGSPTYGDKPPKLPDGWKDAKKEENNNSDCVEIISCRGIVSVLSVLY